MRRSNMVIGIPKEILSGEKRVSATPETAGKLVKDGAVVLVEKGAGGGAFYSDESYIEHGAVIIEDVAGLYEKAELILKVKEPQYNDEKGKHELDMMHSGQYIITFLHPASPANHDMIKKMAAKGITGLTLDSIPRITRAQSMDALTSMSTCAGYKGMLLAINDLLKFVPMTTCAVGTIQPCHVLIIGAGIAGLQALITAKRLGAVVYAMDVRPEAVEHAVSLGAKIIDTGIPPELAIGQGGYAASLPEEWLEKEREVLRQHLPSMDIVYCSALVPGKQAPILINEEMIKMMKSGSVITDVSIDQGGNCSLTVAAETIVRHDVIIGGIKNIPGMIPTSSTWMFANNVYNLVDYLMKDGKLFLDISDEITGSILVTINGEIVHSGTREAMGL